MSNYIINGTVTIKTFLFFKKTFHHRFNAEGISKTEALNYLRTYVLNGLYKDRKVTSIKVIDIYKVR